MTLEEQARVIANQIIVRHSSDHYNEDHAKAVTLIAIALLQQWLETAREADRIVQVADAAIEGCDGDEWIRLNTIIAEFQGFGNWCRQRAKEEGDVDRHITFNWR